MRRCVKCNVNVRGDHAACPLCQGELTGKNEERLYPKVETVYKQNESFFRLLALSSVSLCVVSIAVNLMAPQSGSWALYVFVAMACFWVCLLSGMRSHKNVPQTIMSQSAFLAAISVFWDWLTVWQGWSINYSIPIVFILGMAIMAVVSRVGRIPVEDYAVCLLTGAVFGIVPVVFYLCGWLQTVVPSLICIALSVITLTAILLYKGRDIRMEIIKRFHL